MSSAAFIAFSTAAGASLGHLLAHSMLTHHLLLESYTSRHLYSGLKGATEFAVTAGFIAPAVYSINGLWASSLKSLNEMGRQNFHSLTSCEPVRKLILTDNNSINNLLEDYKSVHDLFYPPLEIDEDLGVKLIDQALEHCSNEEFEAYITQNDYRNQAIINSYYTHSITVRADKLIKFCETFGQRLKSNLEELQSELATQNQNALNLKRILPHLPSRKR